MFRFKNNFVGLVLALSLSSLSVHALDQDGGGCSDVWEKHYGSGPLVANEDADQDGFSNLYENYFNLNPLVKNAAPTQIRRTAEGIEFFFLAPVGQQFQMERSTDRVSWSSIGDPFTGNGAVFVYAENVVGVRNAFYRVKALGAGDQDGDGLDAFEESLIGTDDGTPDSEPGGGDGVPDGWEWSYGLNPLADDSAGDPDNDGRTNLDEYQFGSDPQDYYNGQAPQVSIMEGSPQVGSPEQFFAKALMVRVLDQFSNPLINAPVTFSVTSGDAQVARSNSGSPALHSTLKVETDSEGKALVYLWGGETLGSVTVEAMAGTALALQLKAANQNVQLNSADAFIVHPSFWQALSAVNSKKYLLFEGCDVGNGQLVLTFHKPDGTEIGEGSNVWMDVKNIKKMYQRAKAQPEDIAAPNGDVVGPFTGCSRRKCDQPIDGRRHWIFQKSSNYL
jgi:hypothetical protein